MMRKKNTTYTNEKSEEAQEVRSPDNNSEEKEEKKIIIQRRYNPIVHPETKKQKAQKAPKIQNPQTVVAAAPHQPLSKRLTPERRFSRHYSPTKSRNTDKRLDNQVRSLEDEVKKLAASYHEIIEENEWILGNYHGERDQKTIDKNLQLMLKDLATVSKRITEKSVVDLIQTSKKIENIKTMLNQTNHDYQNLRSLAFSSTPEEIQTFCKFRLEKSLLTQCSNLLLDYNSLNQAIYKYSRMPEHAWINEHLTNLERSGVKNPNQYFSDLEKIQSILNDLISKADNMHPDELRDHIKNAREDLDRAEKIFRSNFKLMAKQLDKVTSKEMEEEVESDWSDWDMDEEGPEDINEKQPKENQSISVKRIQSITAKQNTLFGGEARGNANKANAEKSKSVGLDPDTTHHKTWPRPKK